MKSRNLSLFLVGTALLISACEAQEDTASEPAPSISEQKEDIYKSNGSGNEHYLQLVDRPVPTWAGISYASLSGNVSSDYIAEIEESDSLQFIVEEMIEGSKRQAGIVDVSQPFYDVKMEYEDGSEELFHLWVTEDELTGTIMDSENTHFIYSFSDDVSEQFLSLLPDEMILDEPVSE